MNGFIRFKNRLLLWRKTNNQLNQYYPKNTYDRLARKELKKLLLEFNSTFFTFFPHLISGEQPPIIDYHPKRHSKQYEVERAIELCKLQKVKRKDILKIEEYLNLKYIIEDQLEFHTRHLYKVKEAKDVMDTETYSSFFSELVEERMQIIQSMRVHEEELIEQLRSENRQCEQRINELIHGNRSFIGEAGKFIGEMITESVKRVTHAFRWK